MHVNTKHLREVERAIETADQEDPIELSFCPVCMGEAELIGALGFRPYYSCRYCGYVYGREVR